MVDDPSAALSSTLLKPTVSIDGQRYASLAAAVLAAEDGDVLQLQPGLHGGPVEIRKSLSLEPSASLGAVTIQSRGPSCVIVRGDVQVVIRGLTLKADGPHSESRQAAVAVDGGELSLEYCHLATRANCAVQVLDGKLKMEQCSVLVEGWQTAIVVGEDSAAWVSECRVENRTMPGTALEAWRSTAHVLGGRFSATGAAVAAGEEGTVIVDEAHLIDGGVVALAKGSLTLNDCDLVGSVRAAVRCFGLATVNHCRLLQHAVGLIVSGPTARLTVVDSHFDGVEQQLLFEDEATEAQLFMEETPQPPGHIPSGS